ncbi:type II toxin-antitoxin system mRNA interferase toxin, RelE/StbE family [Candidatus Peregrinibacteria bacterium]|nr:type II toxin-antitoxin system mRNA interferase toxin, RelE/StbE family [Candidatus Peregrinibacteria bacterium]
MIEIVYKPSFIRTYKKLPLPLKQEVKDKIGLFASDPKHPFLKTHKLSGPLRGYSSFWVNYEYRIVFEYESKSRAALLIVGTRQVYDK